MGSRRLTTNGNSDLVTQDEIKIYHSLMRESKIEMDNQALVVISNLLRLGVSPDDIYAVIKEIIPVCGLLKRFKLKPHKSSNIDSTSNN